MKKHCLLCGNQIEVMIFRMSEYCSENHRKELVGQGAIPDFKKK